MPEIRDVQTRFARSTPQQSSQYLRGIVDSSNTPIDRRPIIYPSSKTPVTYIPNSFDTRPPKLQTPNRPIPPQRPVDTNPRDVPQPSAPPRLRPPDIINSQSNPPSPEQCLFIPIDPSDERVGVVSVPLDAIPPCEGHGRAMSDGSCDHSGTGNECDMPPPPQSIPVIVFAYLILMSSQAQSGTRNYELHEAPLPNDLPPVCTPENIPFFARFDSSGVPTSVRGRCLWDKVFSEEFEVNIPADRDCQSIFVNFDSVAPSLANEGWGTDHINRKATRCRGSSL